MLLSSLTWIIVVLLNISLVTTRTDRQFNEEAKEDYLTVVAGPESANAKDNFFRFVRAYDAGQLNTDHITSQSQSGLPKPGGFKLPYLERFRRNIQFDDVNEHIIDYYDISDSGDFELAPRYARAVNDKVKIEATRINIEEALGKPLEIGIIEANINVTTEQAFDKDVEDVSTSSSPSRVVIPKGKALVINDFIRFRRDVKEQNQIKSNKDQVEEFNPIEGSLLPLRTKRERQTAPEGANRQARGATTEQWVKQPYPVIHPPPGDPRYEDSLASAAGPLESVARAPRVNFVTQRRSSHDGQGTSLPPLLFRSPDRVARDDYYYYNNANRPRQGKMWQDIQRPSAIDNDVYYQPRPFRYPEPQYYEDPYSYETRDRRHYDPNRRYYDMQDRYQSIPQVSPPVNRQRRIIYYTTLPEVVRSPPSVDMREKFNKYGGYAGDRRYDSRYVTSSPLSVAGQPPDQGHYHYRPPMMPYPDRHMQKPRSPYGSGDDKGGGSPGVKVSSDDVVSVHELKKNPERRIYGGGGGGGGTAASGDGPGPLGPSYANQEADRAAFRRGPH